MARKGTERPRSDPAIHITLRRALRAGDGKLELTHDLRFDAEIDRQVAALKADLDAAGTKAKRLLAAAMRRKTAELGSAQIRVVPCLPEA
jgi:hypothetical protein